VLEAFRTPGVLEHLPVAAALLVLGVVVVKVIIQGWKAFLATVKEIVTAGIDSHVKEHHVGDAQFKADVRRGLDDLGRRQDEAIRELSRKQDAALEKLRDELREDGRALHERVDEILLRRDGRTGTGG
jgi:hypothetical protein